MNRKREFLAGATTFASMAYVCYINPLILSDMGIDFGAALVATIITTSFATLMMGLLAKHPIAIAPGIGVSAFVTYSLSIKNGAPWQTILGALFLVALSLLLLTIFHLRRKILSNIPKSLLCGISGGVGLFLMGVGLTHVGLISSGHGAFLQLTTPEWIPFSLALISLAALILLLRKGISSAFLWIILLNWGAGLAGGFSSWKGVISLPPSLSPTFLKLDLLSALEWAFFPSLLSIFLVALFDSTAGLMILSKMLYPGKPLPRMQRALYPDSTGSLIGALLGSGTLAVHIESASGIQAGGKTGVTAMVCATLFASCLFFYPLISSIPPFAVTPILLILGWGMCASIKEIPWKDPTEWIPALIVVLTMPLTFSIYKGFSLGFASYLIIKLVTRKWREIPLSCYIFGSLFCLQIIHEVLHV